MFNKRFVDCVKKPAQDREEQDVDFICHTLKKLSEFKGSDLSALRVVSQRLVYELHNKDTILYSPGDKADCWYYVLTGSVMLSMNYFFSTGSSFGQSVNADVRDDQCHVLEDTQLLRINYTEEELKIFASRAAKMATKNLQTPSSEDVNGLAFSTGGSSISTLAASTRDESTSSPEQNKMRTDSQRPPEVSTAATSLASRFSPDRKDTIDIKTMCPLNDTHPGDAPPIRPEPRGPPLSADLLSERHRRSKSEEGNIFSFDPSAVKKVSVSTDSLDKAMQDPVLPTTSVVTATEPSSTEVSVRRRDTDRRRRYSAPPSERRHTRDSVGSLDYLSESQVDSDDEESVQSESSSAASMDAVFEVLSKPSADRTEEDIERVMDVLQYMPVFSNLTSNIRRALFQVLILQSFDSENSSVIDNGEEVSKWYVVLNGQLKLVRESDTEKLYHVGDSFGVSQSLKILPHRGKLVTAERGCTICYCSAEEFGRIMTQGEENLKRITEDGKVVAVLEKRAVDARREGYFVIQATPEMLLKYLVEETMDDTFHKDFLLTYRTFLKNPLPLINRLKEAWQTGLPDQRERIVKIVLNWVTEHFPDFEESDDMTQFLDWFEERLLEDGKVGEKRALDKARTDFPKIRSVELDRPGTNAPLNFTVVGGWSVGYPNLISEVERDSAPEKAGLRVGDMILEINDNKCDKKNQDEVVSILRKNFKLSLKVRSNLPEFKQYMLNPPQPPPETKKPVAGPMVAHVPIARCNTVSAADGRALKTPSSPKTKRKAPKILTTLGKLPSLDKLRRLKLPSRTSSTSSIGTDALDGGPGPLKAKRKMPSRKASQENLLDGGEKTAAPVRASSLEDIHSLSKQNQSGKTGLAGKIVDGVVKLYSPDHTHKYIDVSPTTTISDLILRGVKEFYPDKFVANPTDEYCVCMVSVTSRNGPIRNSVLPNHLADLANFLALESRYYLKARAFHGTLVQDEEAEQIFRESRQWEAITNLSPKQVAEQLTRQDSEVFCSIDASEYIADLWRDPNRAAKKNLETFENIPNDEMYWVVTTVISETRSDIRAKLIKHFIKVAKWCREQKNFNSMFHILSGLNHGLVQRQKSSWEKVPSKYRKTMDDLTTFMNPFHNMAKYRELQRSATPPLVPFFPILKKDLTFLYDGNETQVDGLVNFEKLRMLSQQIRVIKHFCQQPIMPDPPQVDLGRLGGVLKSIHHSIRLRNRHNPTNLAAITDNALKDVFNHHRMMKMVRRHLERKYVVQEEELLERIAESTERVVQLRRNPPSPLNKGKRKSGHHDKHKSNPFSTISPSPTANSIGSDTSAPNAEQLATPPISPRKLSAPALFLATDAASAGESPSHSPSNANGAAQPPMDTPV